MGNWCEPRQINVTAIDDAVVEGTHGSAISHKITGAPIEYQTLNMLQDIIVKIADND